MKRGKQITRLVSLLTIGAHIVSFFYNVRNVGKIYKLPQGLMIAVVKEARSSFSGLRVDVLKLTSHIEDKLRFLSYYIIISTYQS